MFHGDRGSRIKGNTMNLLCVWIFSQERKAYKIAFFCKSPFLDLSSLTELVCSYTYLVMVLGDSRSQVKVPLSIFTANSVDKQEKRFL